MEDKDKLFMAALVLGAILLFFMISNRKRESRFTQKLFTGMTSAQAAASFTQQTSEIVNELKVKMTDAIAAKKSKKDLTAISDEYSQYSCDLTKAYQRFQIELMPEPGSMPAPAPGPASK
jgi:cell shape-determining protein MreC